MLEFFWLLIIFKPIIKKKVDHSKCILIINGYSSHFNMRFIDYCDKYNILFVILSLHFIY